MAVAWALFGCLIVTVGIGWLARSRVEDVEDYVVAGRRLPLALAAPTLLATWYGAGTLLVATDEVRARGLSAIALDPLGAGLCLLLAGMWLAKPLWSMGLVTLPDLFARTWGRRAERLGAALMVPGYVGWVAAQLTALAGVLSLYLDLPLPLGIGIVAVVGVGYTLAGGMWAVALTDAVQAAVMAVGVAILTGTVLWRLGDGSLVGGLQAAWAGTPPSHRVLVPPGEAGAWVAALAAGSLGNLPGQDLTQRLFAAESAQTARRASLLAGVAYLVLGAGPVLLGLAADQLAPGHGDEPVLPLLAGLLLSPGMAAVLVVTVVMAVLSTLDSALLAPAAVIARNLHGDGVERGLGAYRASVAGVGALSAGLAWLGEDAYALLEASYEVTMVSLLVPLVAAVGGWPGSERACLAGMLSGTTVWAVHLAMGWDGLFDGDVPVGLACTALAAAVHGGVGWWESR